MDVFQAELASALAGLVITVLWRIIDRYLPDPTGAHPAPPLPSTPPEKEKT